MKNKKTFIGILVVANIALFAALIVLFGGQFRGAGPRIPSFDKLPAAGTDVSRVLESVFSSVKLRNTKNFEHVVFLFFSDSVSYRAYKYEETFSQASKTFPRFNDSVLLICPMTRKTETIMPAQNDSHELILFHDAHERLRQQWGCMYCANTVIVDGTTGKTVASYPYIMNPYVLCEQLQIQ